MVSTTPSDTLLAGLTDEQRHAVTVEASPLLVLAGAGSGKTRVLTRRIAWQTAAGNVDARRVLAVTFTRKAAAELVRRLRDLGVHEQLTSGTFHALALGQLRRRWLDLGRRPPQLLDRKGRIIGGLVDAGQRHLVTAVAREIEWAQARLVAPVEYPDAVRAAGRQVPVAAGHVARVYEQYQAEKRTRGVVDFDDLLSLLAGEIETDSEFAAAVHWRFRHVFVDEFQDVSPAQYRLLRAWLGERSDLCAVGDGDQAIYGFGGADARYVREFERHFGSGATVVALDANFRSSPQIAAAAYAVLPRSDTSTRAVRPVAGDGPRPVLSVHDDERDEAEAIAGHAARLQREGMRWSSMAVLVRTNAQCTAIDEALGRAGVPTRVRSSFAFVARPEVQAALHELRESERQAPRLPFGAHVERLTEAARSRPALQGSGLPVVLELAAEHAALEGDLAGVDSFEAFVATATRFDDAPPAADGVDVLTFHRAKGLEWPVVFVAGMEDGFVPVAHVETASGLDEERRLLHVALTRAERHLFLSWARHRTFGEQRVARSPSPFLGELAPFVDDGGGRFDTASPVSEAGVEVLARLSETLRNGERPDPLYDALVAWRHRRARAAGVPVEAIADDETLRAISSVRPVDDGALRDVPGLGPARLARYGPEILEVVAGYAG